MSRTILADVDGFTPVIDRIVEELGLASAAVFGNMWRFCQMGDGACKASLETISERLGVDRATVMRHVDKLCEAGYLQDLTPELKNVPHTYVDTGKAGLRVSVTVAECNTSEETVAETPETVALCNETVAESYLKKVLKKQDMAKEKREDSDALKLLEQVAEHVFGNDVDHWRRVRKELRGCQSEVTEDVVRFSGLGVAAALYQDRYGRTFERALVGVKGHPVAVTFEE